MGSRLSANLHHAIFAKNLEIPRLNIESSNGLDRTLGQCPDCGCQRRLKKARGGNQWIITCSEKPSHTVVETDEDTLREWVKRFFQLWSRNQWKRERYAPSFHVDDKNLDPKTWCRFPILSGGFDRELSEL